MNKYSVLLGLALAAPTVVADNSTLEAAIGGGLGGAAGAAIGNELGGRDGAIVGGAIGGGIGAAVTTKDDGHEAAPKRRAVDVHYHRPAPHPRKGFCPPGQAKKGRC